MSELETLEIFVLAKEICAAFDQHYKVKSFQMLVEEKLTSKDRRSQFCIQILPRESKDTSHELAENAHETGEQFRLAKEKPERSHEDLC